MFINTRNLTFRINYDVACNMDFHRFPVDEQYCEVKFESFGFSNRQVSAEIVNMNLTFMDLI